MGRTHDTATAIEYVNSADFVSNNDLVSNTYSTSAYVSNTSFEALKSNSLGRRNIIINGAMQVNQRGNTTTSITNGVDGLDYYSADRMKNYISYGNGDITYASVTTDGNSFKPAFQNSAKYSNLTGGAPTGTQQVALIYYVEGQDLQHLEYGTSNAKTLTLSFWVKTNKTGVYSVEFFVAPTSGSSRGYTKTFTVSSTNWEYHTLTFEGDTASDIRNSSDYGLIVKFWLAAGPDFTSGTLQTSWQDRVTGNAVSSSNVNLADSSSNVFEITGLQMELGDTATPFEHRSYGEELALCQRYYFKKSGMLLYANSTRTANVDRSVFFWPVTMRAAPASGDVILTFSAGGGSDIKEGITDTSCTFGQNNPSAAPVLSAIEASAEL